MTQWFQEFFSDPIFTSTSTNNSLWINTGLTIYMVAWTMALSIVIGIPLGIGLFELSRAHGRVARLAYQVLGFIVNVLRSFPFVILIIALLPLAKAIVGRGTGVVGYTAMAGTVGAGGLGDLAFRKGYLSYNDTVMITTVVVLVILVVIVQVVGDWASRTVDHRAKG